MIIISVIVALVALVIGSITDFKKREVHDYVSYGLTFIAVAISIIYTIIIWDYTPLVHTITGLLIGLGIAYAMFYLGQWGGGDSKLIIGLGAVLGFNVFPVFGDSNFLFPLLIINIILAGAIYGLIFSVYLAIKHRHEFIKNLRKWLDKKQIMNARRILLGFVIISVILIMFFIPQEFKLLLLSIAALLFLVFYVWIFVKIIEESCMIKLVDIEKLTEGDWIFKDVFVSGKYITGPKDLGISKHQINVLKKFRSQGKIKKIMIKEGIPFIPAFFIAFILTIMMYYMKIPSLLF